MSADEGAESPEPIGNGGLARSPRLYDRASKLPASGAWRPGDPVFGRQFFSMAADRPFALEGGGTLSDLTIAYETWGELDASASNAVLVCHALTGDAHAAGPSGTGQPTEGWWDPLIGPGRAIDTDRWFVVCANVLGGCQGTTGPSSIDAATGRPYGSRFPVVSVRDVVRTQAALADHLGIGQWMSVVGGSMGGMQVLEWGAMYPERVRSLAPIATTAAASALQIGWSMVGRRAIAADPLWRDGDYYDAEPGDGPHTGLMLARAAAQIHYRSDQSLRDRFDRNLVERLDGFSMWNRFQIESYLDYHGEKLVRRFDANTYLVLNKLMDLHDIGRGRGGIEQALERIKGPVLTMAVDSDVLYHPYQQYEIRDTLHAQGTHCEHVEIRSRHGHDGFLLEFAQIGPPLQDFLIEIEKADRRP
ncbi:MAG: homoserine O-acetyltransferase [Actinomycetia bacterium]|nr:homoserine O-acetyltransferase [Actinomycetes bacterium]MCP4087360.1 homoserine O-acetyltransferase [Actinomycetes bacterium]